MMTDIANYRDYYRLLLYGRIFLGGMPPDPPNNYYILVCFACMCTSHTVAIVMCIYTCIVSKSQEHVNYLGPGIKIGLVMPLV